MQLTLFWERMAAQFGAAYAQSVAKDYVFAGLGGRTVEQALADGEDAKVVWRAVCEVFDVPERLRLFPGDLGVSVAVEYTFPLSWDARAQPRPFLKMSELARTVSSDGPGELPARPATQ